MKIEQIYTGCLSQGAYYIESQGEVAIIDPLRETAPYITKASNDKARIKYIFETHFHADFVSGHVELAAKTGATIVYGPGAKTEYEIHEAFDGETFQIGNVKMKVLHTPGHTMESATYLLLDEKGKEYAIFSGDTLFIGDVGRPDLAQDSVISQDDLAGFLFDSLREKIMPLPDHVIVYPAHGAGSACGKSMSNETTDLLGNQKKTNYALRADMSKQEFIDEVTEGLLAPPQYFAGNVLMNKTGVKTLDEVLEKGCVALDPEIFETITNQREALVLDTRSAQDFAIGHIPNAIFIGIDGGFAPWVGALIPDLKQPILFVADKGKEEEVVTRLSRVGYDNTLGYLEGGMEAWEKANKEIDTVKSISAIAFATQFKPGKTKVLDVRKESEYNNQHMVGVRNFPLSRINENMGEVNTNDHYHIHCAGGYRSMIAASILKSRGIHNIVDIAGGFNAIKATKIAVTDDGLTTQKR